MTKILGISGSLRRQSYNTSLLRAAQSNLTDEAMLKQLQNFMQGFSDFVRTQTP